MKKIIVVVTIVIAVVATAVVLQPFHTQLGPLRPPYCEYGDVDGDGYITLNDPVYLAQNEGHLTWDEIERGDVNNNGVIDQEDIDLISNAVLYGHTDFPIADPTYQYYQMDTPPFASITLSNRYPKEGDTVTITIYATDENGEMLIVQPMVIKDSSVVSDFDSIQTSPGVEHSMEYTFRSSGAYEIVAAVKYLHRNVDWFRYPIYLSVSPSEGPPYVRIMYPHDGDTVSGIVEISGTSANATEIWVKIGSSTWNNASLHNDRTWSYTWDTSSLQNKEYTITVKAVNSSGYAVTDSINVNVNNVINVEVIANFTYVIDGKTVYFTDMSIVTGATTATYYWDFGDGTTSTEQNPVHTYKKAGKYFVRLTVTAGGKTASVTKTITIEGFNMWYVAGGGIALLAVGAIVWRWRGGKK